MVTRLNSDFTLKDCLFGGVKALHYNDSNSFLFVNATKIYRFKENDSEIKKKHPLRWGNISGDASANNIKKTRLNRCVYHFSIDYRNFDINDVTNIHKYLLKKRLELFKKCLLYY